MGGVLWKFNLFMLTQKYRSESDLVRGRLQRTSGKWRGGGGGFEISDIPGRGEGVVCESSDVRKFLKKIEIPKFLRAL